MWEIQIVMWEYLKRNEIRGIKEYLMFIVRAKTERH